MSEFDSSAQGDLPHGGNGNGKNGNGHAANGNGAVGGTLTTLDGNGYGLPSVSWPYMPPVRPQILSAKPNPVELLHAVRRRWTLAVGLSVTLGLLAGFLVWYFVPVRYEAYATIHVKGRLPAVLKGSSDDAFELTKRTVVQMIQSGVVLDAVVREPAVSRLRTLQKHNDEPVEWLRNQLVLEYPNDAELLRVSMKGEYKSDLPTIVNMVVDKYMKVIVFEDKERRLREQGDLVKAYQGYAERLEKARLTLFNMMKSQKHGTPDQAQIAKSIAQSELYNALSYRAEIQRRMKDNDMEIKLLSLRKDKAIDMAPPDAAVEEALFRDPQIQNMTTRLANFTEGLLMEKSQVVREDTPHIRQMEEMLERLNENLSERKAKLKFQIHDQYAAIAQSGGFSQPGHSLTLDELQMQQEEYEKLLADAEEEVDLRSDAIKNMEGFNATVATEQLNVQALEKITNALKWKIDEVDVEQFAPQDRIRPHDPASISGSRGDSAKKLVEIVFAAVLASGGVLLAIGFFEFQSRKVNTVHEVSDGLGISVVGELPRISSPTWKRLKGQKGQALLKSLISERIDGTRTALIHTTNIRPPRVVMVTSAEPGEGKTTIATQLAASLARSGRRTLLVDADLRNPGAYLVFEMTNEPGVCEVLRGQVELDAAVQPTRTSNLWLLPAGQCDLSCVQALSSPRLGATISALAARYEYVIIDAAPVLKVADPLMVGQHVDASIVSVLRDSSKVPKVYEACERLRSVGITVLGAVVNGVNDDVARHGMELLMAESN